MGLIFGLIKRLIKLAIYVVLFITIVTLIPNLPPYTKFSSIEIDPVQARVGSLKQNGALNNAEKLYENKLKGPEAFALYNGEVYTSLATGEVVKLSPGGHITFVTKLGQPCDGLNQEPKCGRPLGLTIDEKNGHLYVADAYYGIWKVDIKTDKKQQLVSPKVEIEGRKPMLFNAVKVAKNGDLYWTDSTSDFPLNKGLKSAMADPSGRLLHYNAATKKSKVLLDNLWFANGVVISPDNQFVVVSDTNRYRLLKYYIDGPKKGTSEVFLTGLPGVPDNLSSLPDGSGFTVGMYLVFDEESPVLARSIAKTPAIRKFLARIISLIEMPFEFLNAQFPNVLIENVAHNIASFKTLAAFVPGSTGLLVVDWNGNVVESYFNTDGSLKHVSDAVVFQGKLLTGSPHTQDFVGAVPAPNLLKKAYGAVKTIPPPKTAETVAKPIPKPKVEEKKEVPKVAKPVQEPPKTTPPPPKPTTQPPKPTTQPPKPPTQPPKPPTQPPKPTTQPPKPTTQPPKPAEPVKTTPKPAEKKAETTAPKPPATKPMPKAETTTTKPPTTTTKPEPKPTTPPPVKAEIKVEKVETPAAKAAEKSGETKKQKSDKPALEEIPITEEIPSDTRKPTKEKLKVIKKDGPTEIPNPAL